MQNQAVGITEHHAAWLENRGIDVELAAKHGVASKRNGIAIPYLHNGQKTHDKVLLVPRKEQKAYCEPTGVDQSNAWNIDSLQGEVDPRAVLYVTEGELDALSVLQAGERYVVSMPSGAANTIEGCLSKVRRVFCDEIEGKFHLRKRFTKFKRFCLLTDRDADGETLRKALIEVLGENYCLGTFYPDGCKDANDILNRCGVEVLSGLLNQAAPIGEACIIPFSLALKMPSPKQLNLGMAILDGRGMRFSEPFFVTIGGPANSGKSTIAQCMLLNLLASNRHLKASIFHGEGHHKIPAKRAATWYRENINPNTGDPLVQEQRNAWMDDFLSFMKPYGDQLPEFEWLLETIEMHALNFGRRVFMIDPWNEIIHRRDMRGNLTDHIAECIVRLKRLSDQLGLIMIVVHHIKKPFNAKDPPTMYDLADSAHWANKSDQVVIAWRPPSIKSKTLFELAKSKDFELFGSPFRSWVNLDTKKFELYEVDAPEGYENI